MRVRALLLIAVIGSLAIASPRVLISESQAATSEVDKRVLLPIIFAQNISPTPTPTPSPTPVPCEPIPGTSYDTLDINGDPSPLPAEEHPDVNLALRGYTPADPSEPVAIIGDCAKSPDDPKAPHLRGLFADRRLPLVTATYRVWQWDWENNQRGNEPEPYAPVSLIEVAVTPGEILYVPPSGYEIDARGYEVLVLYASEERITLKYTREDSIVYGYTLHLEHICVEPSLLALYEEMNAEGRHYLPALREGQPIGRARGTALGIVIRDTGQWMDPRLCYDWWRPL